MVTRIIVGEIFIVSETNEYNENGMEECSVEIRVPVRIDRRFSDVDMKAPTVCIKDSSMKDAKSGKCIKEIDPKDLLKELEFGYTYFLSSNKMLLQVILRQICDNNIGYYILWSETYNSDDKELPVRLSYEDFTKEFIDNEEVSIGDKKWIEKIKNYGICDYDIKAILYYIFSSPEIAYRFYIDAL